MHTYLPMKRSLIALSIVSAFSFTSLSATAQEAADQENASEEESEHYESIRVMGRSVSYANTTSSEEMKLQQTSMTSALSSINNLPGVLVNEGDPFGSDEWSTSVSIRGFQLDLESQQIGMTIDGIANGNSNYGGGTKANRYIDIENLRASEVSQGTADISSRSHEALGGTINFTSIDPSFEEKFTVSTTLGQHNAQKLYARYDTGEIARDTFAWFSVSSQENDDYMDGAVTNTRDHFAGKIVSRVNDVDLTGYFSYDDATEYTYQRIYGLAQYEQNPEWDGLTSDWSGIPYQDQAWREGWVTERENIFGYLQAEFMVGEVSVSTNGYFHQNEGTGMWIPFYVADVTDDGEGNPHSELDPSTTVYGGEANDFIYFVDRDGVSMSPIEGCESSITSPYGGGPAAVDPGCYEQGATAVSSHRHTHYSKERYGFNADLVWETELAGMPNTVRGGIWYEDYLREEYRDWHQTIDASNGPRAEQNPYWVQYSREFPVETFMYYAENELDAGFARFRFGLKKYDVEVAKEDQIDSSNDLRVSSDSDILISAGVVAPVTAVPGLEVFAGFAENYAAIKDTVLEADDSDVSLVEPETAENFDLGLRYSTPGFNASLTYYNIQFENRITFITLEDIDGIDFLESAAGAYINEGGVDSEGIEASLDYRLTDNLGVYVSYTYNDSTYTDADIAGNRVLGSPRDMGVVSFNYRNNGFFAGLSTKYVGARYMDQANTQRTDSYMISDLYLGKAVYDIGPGVDNLEFRFTINNLFNERYLGTLAPNAGWIGAPRIAALNMKFVF